ncbi:hypothetical protein ACUODJ_17855, partial [Escherichia sp. HC-CC]
MSKSLQKPTILNVETVARSRLFTVESVDLEFSNGVRRVYERMRPTNREAVMIVPIVDDHLILIREYAVGTESYELGFSKGLMMLKLNSTLADSQPQNHVLCLVRLT